MKRLFDITFSGLFLIVLLLPMALLSLAIFWKLGSPIFFTQIRPGLNGKPFKIIKFRTMTNQLGHDGMLLADQIRLTKFGQFMRATSMDELPELWNVLRGDMSLVGPRPLLMEYLGLYTKNQARRHEVLPGITGWAQVNGRNLLSWEEKFELDIWYVDNRSVWLDVKILFLTIGKVFRRDGINARGEATMKKYMGEK